MNRFTKSIWARFDAADLEPLKAAILPVLVAGAVGGAAGALLGTGIGSLKRTWRRVYP